MTTATELRAQLNELQAQHDAIYADLMARAKPGMLFSDFDLAAWANCDVGLVRSWVVRHLIDFAVSDDCIEALLTISQIAALTRDHEVTVMTPRIRELDYVDSMMQLVTCRLHELDG